MQIKGVDGMICGCIVLHRNQHCHKKPQIPLHQQIAAIRPERRRFGSAVILVSVEGDASPPPPPFPSSPFHHGFSDSSASYCVN